MPCEIVTQDDPNKQRQQFLHAPKDEDCVNGYLVGRLEINTEGLQILYYIKRNLANETYASRMQRTWNTRREKVLGA